MANIRTQRPRAYSQGRLGRFERLESSASESGRPLADAPAHEPAERSSYRPDIDGLRAVAVGLVVLQHTGLLFSGGFVGVDVFFVISGFLITRIILSGHNAGTFSLKEFWVRRMRRILPAATVTVVATLLAGFLLLPPRDLSLLAESATAQQFVLANVYFWEHGGYFDLPAERKPLLHTWSLAVEEQFYIVYPSLLLFLRRESLRKTLLAVSAIAVVSLVASEWATRVHPSAAFYFMPTRMWELLCGGLLAFCPAMPAAWLRRNTVIGAVGLLLIFLSAATYTSFMRFPGLAALLPCLGAAFVIAAPSTHRASATALLSRSPFVLLGRASYSIYLWHWPLLVFAKVALGSRLTTAQGVSVVVASMVIGLLSFRFVETPFRSRRWIANDKRFVLVSVLSIAMICAASLAIERWVERQYPEQTFVPPQPTFTADPTLGDLPARSMVLGGTEGVCDQAPTFVLWGDSHAQSLAPLVDSLARSRGICGIGCVQPGYAPLLGAWCQVSTIGGEDVQLQWNEEVVAWIKKHHIRHVLMIARWDWKLPPFDVGPEYEGLLRGRDSSTSSSAEAREAFAEAFRETISTFEAAGVRLWFLKQLPVQDENTYATIAGPAARGVSRLAYLQQQQETNRLLSSISSPMLTVLEPGDHWFDAEGYSLKSDGRRAYYYDDDHLNDYGAEQLVRPMLEPIFEVISKP